MNDPIPEPLRGADVISWAHPVTRTLNALHDKIGAPTRNERDRRASAKPLPFEVRWDATLNDGEGGYKIYLPTEHLLSYGGTYVNTSDISGATPIPDANGDDTAWSVLDDIDTSADYVWLVVTVTESNGSVVSVDAEFSSEEGQSATGENVMNVCIAEVSYEAPENEGDTAVVAISQSVVGAVHLGGEGDGGGGGGDEGHPEPFDIDGDKVVRCNIPAPEAILTCGDYTINPQLGDIYVHVDRQTNGYVLSVDQASRNSSATHAQWLLYNYAGGNITCDCRPKVLPLFDLS